MKSAVADPYLDLEFYPYPIAKLADVKRVLVFEHTDKKLKGAHHWRKGLTGWNLFIFFLFAI